MFRLRDALVCIRKDLGIVYIILRDNNINAVSLCLVTLFTRHVMNVSNRFLFRIVVIFVMASSSSTTNTSWLRTFMDKNFLKDDGSNFHEWESNLRLAVEADGKQEYIYQTPPPPPDLHTNW